MQGDEWQRQMLSQCVSPVARRIDQYVLSAAGPRLLHERDHAGGGNPELPAGHRDQRAFVGLPVRKAAKFGAELLEHRSKFFRCVRHDLLTAADELLDDGNAGVDVSVVGESEKESL